MAAVISNVTELENNSCTVTITFSKGTQMKPVCVQFVLNVDYAFVDSRGTTHTATVEGSVPAVQVISGLSKQMIVTTNSNQWMSAGKVLLEMYTFSDESEISLPRFINSLQRFFLTATQQFDEQVSSFASLTPRFDP